MKIIKNIFFLNLTLFLNADTFSLKWSGKDYNENSSLQYDAGSYLISKLTFNANDTILDVGCGNGKITADIANKLSDGNVIGIDKAPDMIAFAKNNYQNSSNANIKFENIDICDITYKNKFDYVFSFSCLHWVPDLTKAISKIANGLKPNGKLLILMELKNEYPLVRALQEILNAYNLEIDWYWYTQEDIQKFLEVNNFNSIEFKDFHIDKKFKDKKDLENWFASFPYGFNFEETKRKKMIQEITEKYLQYHPMESDGSIFVTFPETVISAIRK